MDISVATYHFKLKFSVCIYKVVPEGRVSQNFDVGLSFFFKEKNG